MQIFRHKQSRVTNRIYQLQNTNRIYQYRIYLVLLILQFLWLNLVPRVLLAMVIPICIGSGPMFLSLLQGWKSGRKKLHIISPAATFVKYQCHCDGAAFIYVKLVSLAKEIKCFQVREECHNLSPNLLWKLYVLI